MFIPIIYPPKHTILRCFLLNARFSSLLSCSSLDMRTPKPHALKKKKIYYYISTLFINTDWNWYRISFSLPVTSAGKSRLMLGLQHRNTPTNPNILSIFSFLINFAFSQNWGNVEINLSDVISLAQSLLRRAQSHAVHKRGYNCWEASSQSPFSSVSLLACFNLKREY